MPRDRLYRVCAAPVRSGFIALQKRIGIDSTKRPQRAALRGQSVRVDGSFACGIASEQSGKRALRIGRILRKDQVIARTSCRHVEQPDFLGAGARLFAFAQPLPRVGPQTLAAGQVILQGAAQPNQRTVLMSLLRFQSRRVGDLGAGRDGSLPATG